MYQVFKKELNGFLNSFVAYIAISVFLVGIGLLMWVFPDTKRMPRLSAARKTRS